MQEGIIKRLTDRGFGFIVSADKEDSDIFFHAKELQDVEFNDLREGDHVGFEIIKGIKGRNAINISRDRPRFDEEKIDDESDEEKIDDESIDDESDEKTDDESKDICEKVRIAIENLSSLLAVMIAKNPVALEALEWRDLERVVAEVFSGIGFDVELTQGSKDGGKDVVVTCTVFNEVRSYAIEIKHWRSGNRVGNGAIMEFLHVLAHENRNGGLFLATHGFCNNAFENLTEIDRQKIRFGTKEKVVSLCRIYVRVQEGIWSPPEQLETVLFEDTN